MKPLNYSVSRVCAKHRDGSFSTISARSRSLSQSATELLSLGFRHMESVEQLKPKHIWALVNHWRDKGIAPATIKNRMSHLRWLAEKTHNAKLIAKDNAVYGIENRIYVTNQDRSVAFKDDQLGRIQDPHVKLSAELQKAFGLRREEAMKFTAAWADKGEHICLKGSWTKGGKERTVPVRSQAQRALLDRVHAFVAGQSLIPSQRSYVQHMRVFEYEMRTVGLGRTHGARHLYAQTRYQELTGRRAPASGGPSRRTLSPAERKLDDQARLTISRELGHERMQIVAVYVGS